MLSDRQGLFLFVKQKKPVLNRYHIVSRKEELFYSAGVRHGREEKDESGRDEEGEDAS